MNQTTTTPDFLMDFYVQFEEWYFANPANHEDYCTCQQCDPEFHLEMLEELND